MWTNLEIIEMIKTLIHTYDSTIEEIEERLMDLQRGLKEYSQMDHMDEVNLQGKIKETYNVISLLLQDIRNKNI